MNTIEFLSNLRQRGVQLWAEGGQLRYRAPKDALPPDLLEELRRRKSDILNFLTQAMAATRSTPPILPVARDGPLPLSFAQQRLWFLDQLAPGLPGYNIPAAFRLSGQLDETALQRCLDTIVSRHESLRTTFATVDGQPVQRIAAPAPFPLHRVDLRNIAAPEREAAAQQLISSEALQPFDLACGPLVRATLVYLAPHEYLVLLTMHHIITDGWSMGVFINELATLYRAFAHGLPNPLPPLPIQYADYAIWQRQWLQGEVLQQQLAYWKQQLGGNLPMLELPTDYPRPPIQTFRGATRDLRISAELSSALHQLSQREGCTLFMLLLAAFLVLLHRYSGQDDIVVGSPIANRTYNEIEGLIGFFVNTLALRGDLRGNPSFRELLRRVRDTTLRAYAHQDLPFERLVEELRPERDMSRTPLFQVMFVLQNAPMQTLELPELTLKAQELATDSAKFDLLLALMERPNGLIGGIEFNTDLFAPATIERMIGHFQELLAGIVADSDQPIASLPLLIATEREQILREWNRSAADPAPGCVHHLLEAQVCRSPDAVALIHNDVQVTYSALNRRANQLAHYLRSLGLGPDRAAALLMPRSLELVLAVLAVLKAGAAYVPIDPQYPPERIAFMLADAQSLVLLTRDAQQSLPERAGKPLRVAVADWPRYAQSPQHNPDTAVQPDNLAYVIYTSGSTGWPKGVAMPHRALVNLLSWQLRTTPLPGELRTLQFASPSFDVSFQELFSTWSSGGTLVLIDEEVRRDPPELLRLIIAQAVERMFAPFVALQQLAEAIAEQPQPPAQLRDLITAGEQLQITGPIAAWMRNGCLLHNQYGPSETHVVTAYTLPGTADQWPPLPPIGFPIANTQIYLLDAVLNPVPVGLPGELYVAGANLARGYLNRPDLTAERFIPNPFVPAKTPPEEWGDAPLRLYKTGDLARYRPDGSIEFLGRRDHQVKIRGFRIEPGEIEAVLSRHPAVAKAVVVAHADANGNLRLVAYIVPREGHAAADTVPSAERQAPSAQFQSALRAFLHEHLPPYMLPAVFVLLTELPLTPSGKVDRRALPAPDTQPVAASEHLVAPRDMLELQLVRIWEEVLGVQPLGVLDSFFDLGGHSLLVVRLMARIQQQFGRRLPLASLFQRPTIEHLAQELRQQPVARPWSPLVGLQPNGSQQPFFCVHPGAGTVLCYTELARQLGNDQPFYALQAAGLEGEQPPCTSVEAMAARYVAALRTVQADGPYRLGGWSFGGVVAFAMAQQLQDAGQMVERLLLLDSWAPTGDIDVVDVDEAALLLWFMRDLGRLHGKELALSRAELQQLAPDEQLSHVLEQARTLRIVPPDIGLPELGQALAVFQANMQALRDYQPRTYAGDVLLYRAAEYPATASSDPTLGWGRLVLGELRVQTIPGDHYSIVRRPQVETLAACLREQLTRT